MFSVAHAYLLGGLFEEEVLSLIAVSNISGLRTRKEKKLLGYHSNSKTLKIKQVRDLKSQ